MIPKIKAHATGVIVTLPNVKLNPPIPVIKITETTNKFLLSPRSTPWSIFKPETAMKPYNAIHTPPMTHAGIVSRNVAKGPTNARMIAAIAVTKIVIVEALPEIATVPMDSPYVVFGHPPKNAPAIEPTPSPKSVLCNPGSSSKSVPIIELKFLWSAMCSANTTNATGT